jgi:hypothetical protein
MMMDDGFNVGGGNQGGNNDFDDMEARLKNLK